MYRENGGDGAEIVPTSSEFPWLIRDLAWALLFIAFLASVTYFTARWERSEMNVAGCTAKR